jgi:lipopolysaccharide transport system ATP-binding protein
MPAAIAADGLSKSYVIGELHGAYGTLRDSLAALGRRVAQREHVEKGQELWALKDVSFDVPQGQVLGIVGRNGAGKSTLLKILTRITTPTAGRAEIIGRVGSLLEVGTGFHPELTGRENVYLNGALLGMKRREITAKFDDIVEFSGVEKFIDTPVKRYSSGMYVRLAFSVAAHLEPEILIVDEVLAVGDAEFQRRCLGRMADISESGRTVLFVSHNMQAVSRLCDSAILLHDGQVVQRGRSADVVAGYLQSGLGLTAERVWPEESAPGDDVVRLLAARVVDEEGELLDAADVRRPVGIEMTFRVLRPGFQLFPKIKVYDGSGGTAFNALDTHPRWLEPVDPGDYVSTAWIPGNLLNEGLMSVQVAVCEPTAAGVEHHSREEAVAFHVQDPVEGDSARGHVGGQWRGAVRPLLDWTLRAGDR